jgi:hypothetical protein
VLSFEVSIDINNDKKLFAETINIIPTTANKKRIGNSDLFKDAGFLTTI